nr:reverse transcriptase domain-containing protein [Tanacetum cinerariifolium]
MFNIFNVSSEDFLEDLFPKQPNIDSSNDIHPHFDDNPLSGSTTYSSNSLLEEFTDELARITYPPDYDDNLQFDIEFDLREIEFLLYQGKYSGLKDSIDQTDLANLDAYFVDPTPEMFTDEHAPNYSFPPRFDVYDDDFLEVESDADNFYDDPFDSKGEKIKESTLLIDKLDLPCDFLPYSEYDSFASQDFSRDDLLPSPNNEDKWIEAKAVATITGGHVKKFVWDNIVCRFGISGEIISDNGKQFSDNPFKDWCDKLTITQRFTSVKHPQSNGLVERANRSLGEGIKSRLGEGNKNWVEELPHVLWAHRTMIKSSHDDTPFSLTYGTEAVIPTEIGMPTYCTAAVDVVNNDEELRLNMDLLEERRECAAICEAKAKSKMMKYYNARVYDVAFKPGDFVYRSNDASHAVADGKL